MAFGGQALEFFAGHISLVVGGYFGNSSANTPAGSRSAKVRRASANAPGP